MPQIFLVMIGAAAVIGFFWVHRGSTVGQVFGRVGLGATPEETAAAASVATEGKGQADLAFLTEPGVWIVPSSGGGPEQVVPATGVLIFPSDIIRIEGAGRIDPLSKFNRDRGIGLCDNC